MHQMIDAVMYYVHTKSNIYVRVYTVEPPNKGHFGTVISSLKRLSLIGRSKMYCNYRERISWDLQLCPCREIVLAYFRESTIRDSSLLHFYVYHVLLMLSPFYKYLLNQLLHRTCMFIQRLRISTNVPLLGITTFRMGQVYMPY